MENQPIWQKHLLLITGITLPFALMAFVLVYQTIATATIPLPRYAPVYVDTNPDNTYPPGTFNTSVLNGHLEVTYTPPQKNEAIHPSRDLTPKVRVYVLKDIEKGPEQYDLSVNETSTDKVTLDLPTALTVRMIPGDTAPDGYTYRYLYRSGGGFISEVFIGGSYRETYAIQKGPRIFSLPVNTNNRYYSGSLRFLGWVEEPLRP